MKDFNYCNPTKIVFGKESLDELPLLLEGYNNILLVCDKGACQANDLVNKIESLLPEKQLFIVDSISPNPDVADCETIIESVKSAEIDFILAVGGGSIIDASKFIGSALSSPVERYWDLMVDNSLITSVLPIGVICTLPATGSEANPNMVITNNDIQSKVAADSELLFPRFAIMNPMYTLTLPQKQTAYGVVDAFVHVLEQYLTTVEYAPLQDRQSEAVMSTLLECGPHLLNNPNDYELRATIMWAAQAAHNGLIACGVAQDWATHRIGHALTALYNIPHAPTLAIVLPELLAYTKADKHDKILQLGERVFQLRCGAQDDPNTVVNEVIRLISGFFKEMGVNDNIFEFIDPNESETVVDCVVAQFNGQTLGERKKLDQNCIKQIMANVLIRD
ncbi:iron-containing alcohol dehydrogenase [Vibrio sinensis]|uniref:Iron-containing alcohol dehydrogenase n=1 Tax=Vibrio sinensis TaxID=2302434 RepID=A0A3A6QQL2_9VIBR|nr:iron-containing alcohol dehydrogenase [Vibrio sinensis]RJX75200.1 iron-containing alcohol dehydrogenase [Vibrio sinensis]